MGSHTIFLHKPFIPAYHFAVRSTLHRSQKQKTRVGFWIFNTCEKRLSRKAGIKNRMSGSVVFVKHRKRCMFVSQWAYHLDLQGRQFFRAKTRHVRVTGTVFVFLSCTCCEGQKIMDKVFTRGKNRLAHKGKTCQRHTLPPGHSGSLRFWRETEPGFQEDLPDCLRRACREKAGDFFYEHGAGYT